MKTLTEGLILREQNIGERDKLVTVLTVDKGIIKGFAKGAKNIKVKIVPVLSYLPILDFA